MNKSTEFRRFLSTYGRHLVSAYGVSSLIFGVIGFALIGLTYTVPEIGTWERELWWPLPAAALLFALARAAFLAWREAENAMPSTSRLSIDLRTITATFSQWKGESPKTVRAYATIDFVTEGETLQRLEELTIDVGQPSASELALGQPDVRVRSQTPQTDVHLPLELEAGRITTIQVELTFSLPDEERRRWFDRVLHGLQLPKLMLIVTYRGLGPERESARLTLELPTEELRQNALNNWRNQLLNSLQRQEAKEFATDLLRASWRL